MRAEQKAKDLLTKMNGAEITDWESASLYAKHELKRKAILVVDEIIATDLLIDEDVYVEMPAYLNYWNDVKTAIKRM